jgi:7,8-dihydropterin-6-yl-methyl-4-(beta-D-ribofuranosyl)aminobenzene 5'-phosphate synthase
MVISLHASQGLAENVITILDVYDNLGYREGVKTDHGFSCLIRGAEKTILFDTGAHGRILMANLEKLSIDPGFIDIVVLSHIHWDHIGGLHAFLEKNPLITLYVPRSFLKMQDFTKSIQGFDPRLTAVAGPQPVCRDVYSTGMMGARLHEQALVIRTEKGSIVITGAPTPALSRS